MPGMDFLFPAAPTPQTRQTVKCAAIVLVAFALLTGSYVGSYGVAEYLVGRGNKGKSPSISNATRSRLNRTVFAPIHLGTEYRLPLCLEVRKFGVWCYAEGCWGFQPRVLSDEEAAAVRRGGTIAD